MMIKVFKAIHFDTMPKYLSDLFQMRNTTHNVRGSSKLVVSYLAKHNNSWIKFLKTCISNHVELTDDLRYDIL